jgi:hypothetical protein
MMNDRRCDVIGQVAENKTSIASSATAQVGNIDRENVGVKDFDTRLAPKLLFEFSSQGGVNFNGDHLSRAPGEQASNVTAPGADFDNEFVGLERERSRDAAAIARIGQEMLAKFGAAESWHEEAKKY